MLAYPTGMLTYPTGMLAYPTGMLAYSTGMLAYPTGMLAQSHSRGQGKKRTKGFDTVWQLAWDYS
jgi:hypothetical protein